MKFFKSRCTTCKKDREETKLEEGIKQIKEIGKL